MQVLQPYSRGFSLWLYQFRLNNIGMPLTICCGNSSVQSFSLAFVVNPLLCWVQPCCSLSKPIGRIGSLFMDINESPKHQTWATKPLTILPCCCHHINWLLSKKEIRIISTRRQSIEQLCPPAFKPSCIKLSNKHGTTLHHQPDKIPLPSCRFYLSVAESFWHNS